MKKQQDNTLKLFRITSSSTNELGCKLQKVISNIKAGTYNLEPDLCKGKFSLSYAYSNSNDLLGFLENHINLEKHTEKKLKKTCFLFTGQGSQHVGMAKDIYSFSTSFKQNVDSYLLYLKEKHDLDLKDILLQEKTLELDNKINQTKYTQPSLVVFEIAMAKLWLDLGINPDYIIGHSVGEIAASYIAGFYTIHDCLDIVANRAKLMQQLPKNGGMLACMCDKETILSIISKVENKPYLSIDFAGFNSFEQTILSGDIDIINDVRKLLKQERVKSIPLKVSHPFHSKKMQEMIPSFKKAIANIKSLPRTDKKIKVICNIDSTIADEDKFDCNYWCEHIVKPVDFINSILCAHTNGCRTFIEVGPTDTLSNLAKKILQSKEDKCTFVSSFKKSPNLNNFFSNIATLGK